MREIQAEAKTVRELLKGVKYSIDYYQREYEWESKQVRELVDDLTNKFLEEYQPEHQRQQVAEYPHYFLGSIIISSKDGTNFVVDGQQRLTTLTLLLMYLREIQQGRTEGVNIDELIVSEKYGQRSFNLDVDERAVCMESLLNGDAFDDSDAPASVQNIVARYEDVSDAFPEELKDNALPFFIDWILENVHLVEVTAYSDDDAYLIFETMNDRGLSLSPVDMLKGYLLANVTDLEKRADANDQWRNRIQELDEAVNDGGADCIKSWLRSQYAMKIRERTKGATPEDFDRIGTEFHRWLREAAQQIGLAQSDGFYRFIVRDFKFYSRQYLRLMEASEILVKGLEHVAYNADHGFTLQFMVLLAPLRPEDPADVTTLKLRLVARYIDILLARRIWNFRSTAYSTMQYAMYLLMREIRGLESEPLARRLFDTLDKQEERFDYNELYLHQQNRYALHRLLARMTDYVETQSGNPSHYNEYIWSTGKKRFEVEHIWANKPELHREEFPEPRDFAKYRNYFGGLLLLPKSFNASYGDLAYEEKLPHYNTQNLLARTLHPLCYERNPGFLTFIKGSGLPFRAHDHFAPEDLDERHELYRLLAERIWDPENLLREVQT